MSRRLFRIFLSENEVLINDKLLFYIPFPWHISLNNGHTTLVYWTLLKLTNIISKFPNDALRVIWWDCVQAAREYRHAPKCSGRYTVWHRIHIKLASLAMYGLTNATWYWHDPLRQLQQSLPHWGRDNMAANFRRIFSDALSWMKSCVFWLKFHWSLFLMVQLTITQHWFR